MKTDTSFAPTSTDTSLDPTSTDTSFEPTVTTGLQCSRCAAPFHCGMDDAGDCWCTQLPKLPAAVLEAAQSCLCEACLRSELARAGVST